MKPSIPGQPQIIHRRSCASVRDGRFSPGPGRGVTSFLQLIMPHEPEPEVSYSSITRFGQRLPSTLPLSINCHRRSAISGSRWIIKRLEVSTRAVFNILQHNDVTPESPASGFGTFIAGRLSEIQPMTRIAAVGDDERVVCVPYEVKFFHILIKVEEIFDYFSPHWQFDLLHMLQRTGRQWERLPDVKTPNVASYTVIIEWASLLFISTISPSCIIFSAMS